MLVGQSVWNALTPSDIKSLNHGVLFLYKNTIYIRAVLLKGFLFFAICSHCMRWLCLFVEYICSKCNLFLAKSTFNFSYKYMYKRRVISEITLQFYNFCHVFVYTCNIHSLKMINVSFKLHFILFLKVVFFM